MEERYEVTLDGEKIGEVRLCREGLYLKILCSCRRTGEEILRLNADLGNCRENIGILVPRGENFVIERKIPAKRLAGEKLRFLAERKTEKATGLFVPISPEEPFSYIARLQNAFLENRNGVTGIVIRDPGA